ncbi:hypothetical protein BDZ45DRAFT_806101 [Acephala macrosclerotiorum]|nr:hypothetical protein BDZ45DRAFT_806101 [Acephala macrosclerotiorum]
MHLNPQLSKEIIESPLIGLAVLASAANSIVTLLLRIKYLRIIGWKGDSADDEFGTVCVEDGDYSSIRILEFGLQVGVLDEVGSTVYPFGGGLGGAYALDAAAPVVEERQENFLALLRVPLENVAGKFPVYVEVSVSLEAEREKLRSVTNQQGERWVLAAGVSGSGHEAVGLVGSLTVSESELGTSNGGVAHYIPCGRPLDVDMIDSFDAKVGHVAELD